MPRFSIPVLCLLLIAHAALGQPVNEEQQSITPLSVEATATIQWDE
jgi:hypothetical protein